jgi:hypothetical protein
MRRITLYTKPGCHLCDEVLDLLLILGDELDEKLGIKEINILEEPGLYARYRHTIPVITIDPDADGLTLYAPITPSALRRALGLDLKQEADPDKKSQVPEFRG